MVWDTHPVITTQDLAGPVLFIKLTFVRKCPMEAAFYFYVPDPTEKSEVLLGLLESFLWRV